jgi:long-chain acyl-CoA synthetase
MRLRMAAPQPAPLDVTAILTGKRVLFAGATGFVGKVALSMLLHHYGDELDHVYVIVRRGSSKDATSRFFDKVAPSEPFEPLRTKFGEANVVAWLKQKSPFSMATSPTPGPA